MLGDLAHPIRAAVAVFLGAAACQPAARAPAPPPVTRLDVVLPPPGALPPDLAADLRGVHFVITPLPAACAGMQALDVVAPLSDPVLAYVASPYCDYSVAVELGPLDATGRALAAAEMASRQLVPRALLAGRAVVPVHVQLAVTPAGALARLGQAKDPASWVLGHLPGYLPPLAPAAPAGATPPPALPPIAPPQAGVEPGANVQFVAVPQTHQRSDPDFGPVLLDIMDHEAPADANNYADRNTLGHETTHGINAYLRHDLNHTGRVANGFYVLDGRGAIVPEPSVRKSQVAALVPPSLRGGRYSTYMAGQPGWDNRPLYVWDEWSAYVNGAAVAVDRFQRGFGATPTFHVSDEVFAVLEMTVYALTTGMTVAAYDAPYFASTPQFRELLAWQTKRAMALYRAGIALPPYAWSDADRYLQALRTSPDADALRRFTRQTFGDAWTRQVLGF